MSYTSVSQRGGAVSSGGYVSVADRKKTPSPAPTKEKSKITPFTPDLLSPAINTDPTKLTVNISDTGKLENKKPEIPINTVGSKVRLQENTGTLPKGYLEPTENTRLRDVIREIPGTLREFFIRTPARGAVDIFNAANPKQFTDSFNPTDVYNDPEVPDDVKIIFKTLLGSNPIKPLATEVAEKELAHGGPGKFSTPYALLTTTGLAALDFSGFGGEKKGLAIALKETKTAEQAANILRKAGLAEDLIDIYAPAFAQSKTVQDVNKGLGFLDTALMNTRRPLNDVAMQVAADNLESEVTKAGKILPNLGTKPVTYDRAIHATITDSNEAKSAFNISQVADNYQNEAELFDEAAQSPAFRKETQKGTPTTFGNLTEGVQGAKDISGFKGQFKDIYRNFEQFFDTSFPEVKKAILDPFDASKGKYVDSNTSLLDELKSEIVDNLGIKKGSKESAAVMDYGERNLEIPFKNPYARDYNSLVKEFGEAKANNIVAADAWFRKKYDTLLDQINEIRAKIYPNNPDKIIPKRSDYYRHFRELTGLEGLKAIFETPAGISPELAGISPFTKPRSKFVNFALQRMGWQSTRDAVGGFINYVPQASYSIHIDPHIGQFRKLAKDIAIQTAESRNANNFIEFLHDYANDLAGKTNSADRFVQKIVPGGRKTFAAINWINNRIKANMLLGNLSSSVAQVFGIPAGIGSAKQYSIPGATRTLASIFEKNPAMAESTFIKERYSGSTFNQFNEGMLANAKKFANWITGVGDEIGTKFIWNSHYEKGLAEGVPDAIKYADDTTRKLVAGRGIGEVPLGMKAKVTQLLAPFQLEVGNAWYVLSDFVKAKDFSGLATFMVANYLMNRVAEEIRGNDVTFDPINAVYEGAMTFADEENKGKGALKFLGRQAGEILSNIPFGQTLASWYPENGFAGKLQISRRDLLGEGDPTRFGGGILVSKGLQDPLFKLGPNYGGTQLKRSIEGIKSYGQGEVKKSNGTTKFEIDKTFENMIKAYLFGSSATGQAKDYYDSVGKKKEDTNGLLPELPALPKLPLPELPKLPKL